MKYHVAQNLIEEAARDIDQAEAVVGQASTTDSAAIFAAIAQAKLLAVIASALTEMSQSSYSSYEDDKPYYPMDRQG